MSDRQFGIDLDNHITGEPEDDFADERNPQYCDEMGVEEMTLAVWKYTVPVDDADHTYQFGSGSPVLHVAAESLDLVAFWIENRTLDRKINRKFRVFGTGHSIPDMAVWRGTVPIPSAGIVWHLYETTLCDE